MQPVRTHETRFPLLIGDSPVMEHLYRAMGQVVERDVNVLITGESGTGKELVARSLHQHSARAKGPFVPINCGAIAAELLESELFGHEKGAFTGALSHRLGRFEMADGGTLFLDEVGDMPKAMQVKLLRVIQERCFERVGGSTTIHVDVRIIAATHKNLDAMTAQGEFREDLFYRLNVYPIETPPLRERTQDIPLLLQVLADKAVADGLGKISFQPAALASLQHYAWPGNVRELANLVERLAIMHPDSDIALSHLPEKCRFTDLAKPEPAGAVTRHTLPAAGIDLKQHLESIEQGMIVAALERSDYVVARAAQLLTIRRTTLVEKMRKYGIQRQVSA